MLLELLGADSAAVWLVDGDASVARVAASAGDPLLSLGTEWVVRGAPWDGLLMNWRVQRWEGPPCDRVLVEVPSQVPTRRLMAGAAAPHLRERAHHVRHLGLDHVDHGAVPQAGVGAEQHETRPLEIGRKLFVDGKTAYVGHFTGYTTIDVSDPAAMTFLGGPPTTQLAVHDITANGSGLLLPVTSFAGESTLALSLYDVSDPRDGGRKTPGGLQLSWKAASLGARNPLPIFFIQHLTPVEQRRKQFNQSGEHPNRALRADRVYVAVPDVAAEASVYSRVLGVPVPKIQRGNVIKADMAVFDLGPTGHHHLVLGQVVHVACDDAVLDAHGNVDPAKVLFLARMGGSTYIDSSARFTLDWPKDPGDAVRQL